jgi:hypothetical protein
MFATHKQALFAASVYNLTQYELFRMNKILVKKVNKPLKMVLCRTISLENRRPNWDPPPHHLQTSLPPPPPVPLEI